MRLPFLTKTNNRKTAWEKWPKWDGKNSFRTPRFNFSFPGSDYSGKTTLEKIPLLKNRELLEIYRNLTIDTPVRSIFEIGFFQGGMPLFLADMIAPEKIVAVDWSPPSEELMSLIARNGLSSSIELIGDIDQADTGRIRSILDDQFGSEPLDLIIDDCSHYYAQTKACIEALFGYLKPGGKYVIEDWGWTHWPKAPWQTDESPFLGMESMTNLIFELVMALGSDDSVISGTSDDSVISGITIANSYCVIITRGTNLPYKAPIDLRRMTHLAGGRQAKLIVGKQPHSTGNSAADVNGAGARN
jgi:SAM-dependent methyltransferase